MSHNYATKIGFENFLNNITTVCRFEKVHTLINETCQPDRPLEKDYICRNENYPVNKANLGQRHAARCLCAGYIFDYTKSR